MSEELLARVVSVNDEAENIRSFTLVSENGKPFPAFTPGAHIDLILDNGLARQYSLCNNSTLTDHYKIAVLREQQSRGGSSYIFDTIRNNDVLHITSPNNHFKLDETHDKYLLLAGGIGITPIISMAYRLAELGKQFEFHYVCRTPEKTAFSDELKSSSFGKSVHIHHSYGEPNRRLDINQLLSSCASGTQVYTCGPEPLIETILKNAEGKTNVSVFYECFFAQHEVHEAGDKAFEIELASSGKVLPVTADESILDVLNKEGITVETMCKEGVCGTCEIALLEGEAEHRDSVLTDDEKAENSALMVCCSRAKTKRLKLDL